MHIKHPYEWISSSVYRSLFIFLFILTLLVLVALQVLGMPLMTKEAPAGIVSFEFAGDLFNARSIKDSWGQVGRIYAGLNLGLDFLFLVSYSSAISLGCILVVRGMANRSGIISSLGVLIAWSQFAAAILDSVENYALIKVLLGSSNSVLPLLAKWCAIPKFIIVAAGLVFVIAGAIGIWISLVFKRHERAA